MENYDRQDLEEMVEKYGIGHILETLSWIVRNYIKGT